MVTTLKPQAHTPLGSNRQDRSEQRHGSRVSAPRPPSSCLLRESSGSQLAAETKTNRTSLHLKPRQAPQKATRPQIAQDLRSPTRNRLPRTPLLKARADLKKANPTTAATRPRTPAPASTSLKGSYRKPAIPPQATRSTRTAPVRTKVASSPRSRYLAATSAATSTSPQPITTAWAPDHVHRRLVEN